MSDEILDELNRIADGVWTQRMSLNQEKLGKIDYLSETGFSNQFDNALNNWLKCRKLDWKNRDSSIEKILGVNSSDDYWNAYHKFLDVVTTAKSKDLIADNQVMKELDQLREDKEKNDKILKVKDDMIKQLKNENEDLHDKVDLAIKTYGTLKKILYGGKNESEVKEDV